MVRYLALLGLVAVGFKEPHVTRGILIFTLLGTTAVVVLGQRRNRRMFESNQLLVNHRHWRESLDYDTLSLLEKRELHHELDTIQELHEKGRNFDNIIERRLRKWLGPRLEEHRTDSDEDD